MAFRISSSAFKDDGYLPPWYARSGGDSSPPLGWTDSPEGTVSLALIVTCTDVETNEEYCHWIVYNIPQNSDTIFGKQSHERSMDDGRLQGENSFGDIGWDGPADEIPEQELLFSLYALDTALDLEGGASLAEVRKAMEGHVLDTATLTGRYTPR
jgi:Raf kinase inhibitor-like YbhB/YbcL family protein